MWNSTRAGAYPGEGFGRPPSETKNFFEAILVGRGDEFGEVGEVNRLW